MGCLSSAWGALSTRIMDRICVPEDSINIRARKAYTFTALLVSAVFIFMHQCMLYRDGKFGEDGYGLFWTYSSWIVVNNVFGMALMWMTRKCGNLFFVTLMFSATLQIMLFDLYMASGMATRAAATFVVVLDLALIGNMPDQGAFVLMGLMVLWLLILQFESVYRWGIFDVWGTQSLERRRGVCECERPPCAMSFATGMSGTYITVFVFVLDFFFTRRFAVAGQRERQRMQAVIVTSENVAAALARFDLDAAKESLTVHGDGLPPELMQAFRTLVDNLGTYKPYLPLSCLPIDEDKPEDDESIHTRDDMMSESDRSTVSADPPRGRSPSFVSSRSSVEVIAAPTQHVGAIRSNFLKYAKVTLVNMSADIPSPSVVQQYVETHERFLASVLKHAGSLRGVVDAFLANCVIVSYNASRPCATHARSALATVAVLSETFGEVRMTGAIGTALVMVGVLGTETMRRQSVVGGLPIGVEMCKRYGQLRDYDWVCSRATYADAWIEARLRIVLDTVQGLGNTMRMVHHGSSATLRWAENKELDASADAVYEVLITNRRWRGESVASLEKADPDTPLAFESSVAQGFEDTVSEWMYEVQRAVGKEWEAYNEAGVRYLIARSKPKEALRLALHTLHLHKAGSSVITMFRQAALRGQTVSLEPRMEDVVHSIHSPAPVEDDADVTSAASTVA